MNPFESFRSLLANTGVNAKHIIHVGAHQGQELSFYRGLKFRNITLVEPIPELAGQLRRELLDIDVVEIACSSPYDVAISGGKKTLHVMHPTNVSTLVEPGPNDRVQKTITVPVTTMANLVQDMDPRPNIAVIDVQGKELDVLEGAILEDLDMVIVETSTVPDPVMASPYDSVVDYLEFNGFREHTYWARNYREVNHFARGREAGPKDGQIRDVIFVKEG